MDDLRRAFGGPLDQLTRLWFDNSVDSIGGINPALAWVYDQRGRLASDTAFTGATARATSYTYDAYDRPSTTTDALGVWTLRYESARGYPDTLLTPFADTVIYTFDARDRAVGPTVQNGSPGQTRVPTWNTVGALRTLTQSVATPSPYTAGKWDRTLFNEEDPTALGPTWTEQHGVGAAMDSLQDSVTYDGWERVTAWVQRHLNGSWVARDTFRFDRLGNIQTTAGAETYDATTGRLLSRTDTAGTWSYTYDRAGNLVQAVQGSVTWTYGYDAVNRLRSVWRNGVFVARYAYDVLGRRIVKRARVKPDGAGPIAYTRFVYRGANVAFETDSAGIIWLRYTWGPGADDLLAIRDAAGNHFYVVQDRLRSVRGLVRRDGTWARSQRFGPYGVVVAQAQDTNPSPVLRYAWTGREFDVETGFYYHRSRYYDPGVRRFVQEDKIAYAGGANVYAYGEGRPLEGRDPTGHRVTLEDNPDWYTLDAFSGCFYYHCAEMEYFFGLTGSGGGSRRMRHSVGCIGNGGCEVDPNYLTTVVTLLTLAEIVEQLDASLRLASGPFGPRPDPLGEFIFGITNRFAGEPQSVYIQGFSVRGAFIEGRWHRSTPTIFGTIYTLFDGLWNGYRVHGEILVQTVATISIFEGYLFPGWMTGPHPSLPWLAMY